MSRLQLKYKEQVLPELKNLHPGKNAMDMAKMTKIVISMGLSEALKDKNAIQDHGKELGLIAGQKAVATKAKKAISNFKLREGQPIGLMVTLRGKKMYDFLDRFCNIVAPRIRDFRGFEKKGDRRGNFNFGINDQQIFPEINLDEVKRAQGMNITIVTTAKTDDDCFELLSMLGFPFK